MEKTEVFGIYRAGGQRATVPPLLPRIVKKALREFDGDIPLTASRLNVSISSLDRTIRLSKEVHRFVMQMKRTRVDRSWDGLSLKDIEEDVLRKAALYRSEAQDEIYRLATMPISDNSAQLQVKLSAAVFLFGKTGESTMGSEIDGVLQRLDQMYKENAPRIRSVRERVIEFEERPAEPRVIEESADPDPQTS